MFDFGRDREVRDALFFIRTFEDDNILETAKLRSALMVGLVALLLLLLMKEITS